MAQVKNVSGSSNNPGKSRKNRPFHPIYKRGRLVVYAQKDGEGIRFFIEHGSLKDLPQGLFIRLSICNYAVEVSKP